MVLGPLATTAVHAKHHWSKPYIGGHIGLDWSNIDGLKIDEFDDMPPGSLCCSLLDDPVVTSSSDENDSIIGGVLMGFNFHRSGKHVFGIEGDVSWTGADARASSSRTTQYATGGFDEEVFETREVSTEVNWKATLRARAGRLVSDHMLLYLTAGVAFADVETRFSESEKRTYTSNSDACGAGCVWPDTSTRDSITLDDTHVGYVLGGGLEIAASDRMKIRGEVLYYDLGDETYRVPESEIYNKIDLTETVARIAVTFDLTKSRHVPLK